MEAALLDATLCYHCALFLSPSSSCGNSGLKWHSPQDCFKEESGKGIVSPLGAWYTFAYYYHHYWQQQAYNMIWVHLRANRFANAHCSQRIEKMPCSQKQWTCNMFPNALQSIGCMMNILILPPQFLIYFSLFLAPRTEEPCETVTSQRDCRAGGL